MADRTCDVAVIGLGVMGANFARNFASRGLRVAVFDRLRVLGQLELVQPDGADMRVV